MVLDDTQGGDIDPNYEKIVVVFNATQNETAFTDNTLTGLALELHPVQKNSTDPLLKITSFDAAAGALIVPGWTTVVYVLKATSAEPTVTPLPANTPIPLESTAKPPFAPTATSSAPDRSTANRGAAHCDAHDSFANPGANHRSGCNLYTLGTDHRPAGCVTWRWWFLSMAAFGEEIVSLFGQTFS